MTVETLAPILESLPGESAPVAPLKPSEPPREVATARNLAVGDSFYVPIAIGRAG